MPDRKRHLSAETWAENGFSTCLDALRLYILVSDHGEWSLMMEGDGLETNWQRRNDKAVLFVEVSALLELWLKNSY